MPGRLVLQEVPRLVAEAPGLGAGLQAGLAHDVAGLVEMALGDAALAAGDPPALRHQEMLGWLEAPLAVPNLTAEKAAASPGLSRRWLHALPDGAGTSFRPCITRRRLEICRARRPRRHDHWP